MRVDMCARIVAAGDFARAGKSRVEIDRRVEVAADETSLIGRAELEPRVADRVAGRLAEAAMARPLQEFGKPHELVDLVARAAAVGDLVERVANERRSGSAGRAEAATLVGEKVREIARDVQDVAVLAENHEGSGGRNVLERDLAAEFVGRQADAAWAADLDGDDVAGPAVLQHLLNAHAERIFVYSRSRAVAGHRKDFASRRMPRSAPREIPPAINRDIGRVRQRLDVVDDCRLAEIADRHRVRRADARLARLALERFDESGFLAADVGARAEMDFNVEVEALRAADGGPQESLPAHCLELGLERLEEILVFAAQIDEAFSRADHEAGDRHPLEDALGERGEQNAILERPGLAFVGVADDEAVGAGRVAAALPFDRGDEAGSAAPAQVRALHLV